MNMHKVRRLRTFLHCKCMLAMQQRPSKLSKDFMCICSHVALLHFVLVSSIFFLLYKFLDETRADSSPCALKKGCSWLCPPMDLVLCIPYPLLLQSCGPLLLSSFLEEWTSVSQIRVGSQEHVFLGFWRRGEIKLWISWEVRLVGAGAGYHAGHVLPVTGADRPEKAIGKAAKPEIRPFSDA